MAGRGRLGKQETCVLSVPHSRPFSQSRLYHSCTQDRIHQMLIMCLFSLSAILALVLIAIYILQHFTLGKEPTLMVPQWQNQAVKGRTICCLLRWAWSALALCVLVCLCTHLCVCVYKACTCTHAQRCVWSRVCMFAHICAWCVCERDWRGGDEEGGIWHLSLC